uniref:Sperm associated antigen 17 n=1 Tax=Petromyzon marinus TaxID=7757 RepID=S4RXD3_PETMA
NIIGMQFRQPKDGWQASVAMVVCGRVEDEAHIPAMLQAIRVPLRRLFTAITWDDVMTQINELGNPKGKRPKDLPVYYEILEVAKTAVDAGQAISLPVLAKLIKFMLLGVKQKDQQWREAKNKAAEEKAKEMAEVDCGKEPVKSPVKKRGKSAKGNKGKKLPEPPQIKKDTKLMRRGEQGHLRCYSDDEPDDGPQHYVFLMGFLQPQLLPMLKELGVTVSAVICVSSQTYTEDKPAQAHATKMLNSCDLSLSGGDIVEELLAGRVEELQAFWRYLSPVLEGVGHGYSLDTVARLQYTVHNSLLPEDPADQNTMVKFGAALFEDMACLMYDLLDWRQHYRHYLNNMELLQIPTIGQSLVRTDNEAMQASEVRNGISANGKRKGQPSETTDLPPLVREEPSAVDMRFYRDLLDPIPPECVSVPLMIHCILEQVVATEEGRPPPSQLRDPPRADGLHPDLANSLSAAANRFPLSPDDNESLAALFGTSLCSLGQEHIKPKILSFNDEIMSRTHHLQAADGLDVAQIEKDMLRRLPVCGMLLDPGLHKVDNATRIRAQELLQYCSGCAGQVEQASMQHAVRQFVFENLELSSVDEAGELTVVHQADNVALAWDNPLAFAKNVQRQNMVKDRCASAKSQIYRKVKNLTVCSLVQTNILCCSVADRAPLNCSQHSTTGSCQPTRTHSDFLDFNASLPVLQPLLIQYYVMEAQHYYLSIELRTTVSVTDVSASHADDKETHKEDYLNVEIEKVQETQLRCLDDWNYTERYEPDVLIQVLVEASERYICMDTYRLNLDGSLLLFFHNPMSDELQSLEYWDIALHTNVSFRDYLEHVAELLTDWLRGQENTMGPIAPKAKAMSLPVPATPTSKSKPDSGRKKKGSAAVKADKAEEPPPPPKYSSSFVREGSLKAWKEERERARQDAEEAERVRAAKKGGGKRDKSPGKAHKDDKRSASKRSPRQKEEAKKEAAQPAETPRPRTPPDAPRQRDPFLFYQLLGYDMDGKLVQVYGKTISLYPSDGGIIRVETTQFIQGCTSVRVCVQKDGHRFLVHRLNAVLVSDGHEEACRVTPEVVTGGLCNDKHQNLEKLISDNKFASAFTGFPHGCEGSFGSFTATLSDGITLSFSSHGPGGKSKATKEDPGLVVALSIPSAMAPTPLPSANPTSPLAGVDKRSKSPKSPNKLPEQAKQEPSQVERVEEKLSSPSTLALSMSCPNGLSMHIYTDTSIGTYVPRGATMVREAELVQLNHSLVLSTVLDPAGYELSRVVTSDGTVVRSISDGSTQVLFADGSVSFSPDSGPVVPPPVAKPEKQEEPDLTPTPDIVPRDSGNKRVGRSLTKSTAKRGNSQQDVPEPPPPLETVEQPKTGTWFTTTPLGHTIGTCGGERLEVKPVRFYKATDPQTGAVMITREDKVVTVTDADGRIVADHVDGTRITTYHRHILDHNSDEQETGEGMVRTVRRVKCVRVESVGLPTLQCRPDEGSCITLFGSGTVLHAKPDGTYQLCPSGGEGSLFIASDGEARYSPGRVSSPALDSLPGTRDPALTPGTYFLRHVAPLACEAVDVYGNHFQVLCNGEASTSLAGAAGAGAEDERGDGEEAQKPARYDTHAPRLFAIHADGSGTELIRREDAERFLSWAEGHPITTVIRDTLPDHPAVQGVTVLSPVEKDVRQRWLLQKQESDITPQSLRSRQWRTFPAREEKKAGPRFGTCIGRGLTIDRPCELNVRPAVSPCVEKRPDVLRARQLLCYPAVTTEMRCKLQLCLKEYLEQLLQREKQREEMKIQDPRLADEKTHISQLLKLVLSMPEDSPRYYNEDERRAELADLYEQSFTTQPPSFPPDAQAEQEYFKKSLWREEASQRTQALWAEKIAKERQEVEQAKEDIQALKHKIITPYFSSELGRTFLLSQAMDLEALSKEVPHTPRKPSPALDCTSEDGDSCHLDYRPMCWAAEGSAVPMMPAFTTSVFIANKMSTMTVPAVAERHLRDATRHHAKSLALDVTGSARRERVRLPAAVLASRPRSVHNEKVARVSQSHPKIMESSSITNVGASARSEVLQGFTLLPTRVNFGCLRQGSSNVRRIRLQNVGTEQHRFKVKAPPSSTGIRVIYTPGPVAAGIHIELILELKAENLGPVSYEVQIQTEAETLLVPVTANILSQS